MPEWFSEEGAKEVKFTYQKEEVTVKVRPFTWSKRNQIIGKCLQYSKDGIAMFDTDEYYKQALEYVIVEAPWGATNRTFLNKITPTLGAALEKLIPRPFEEPDVNFFDEE